MAIDSAEECVGYLLYRISRERAIIVHLCVTSAARRNGIASRLIEYLKAEVKDLKGLAFVVGGTTMPAIFGQTKFYCA